VIEKKAIVFSIYKGGDRSLVGNYLPVSVNSLDWKQIGHVLASYLREIWEMIGWLYDGKHGFRTEY